MPRSSTRSADPFAILRRVAQATHESRPGALELLLLLALLASLLSRLAPGARTAWHHPASSHHPASEPAPLRDESRAANRLRAWIGWILRFLPGLGMTPSGARPAPPRPSRTARAPPPRA